MLSKTSLTPSLILSKTESPAWIFARRFSVFGNQPIWPSTTFLIPKRLIPVASFFFSPSSFFSPPFSPSFSMASLMTWICAVYSSIFCFFSAFFSSAESCFPPASSFMMIAAAAELDVDDDVVSPVDVLVVSDDFSSLSWRDLISTSFASS